VAATTTAVINTPVPTTPRRAGRNVLHGFAKILIFHTRVMPLYV
jgi:hypothetical protein